MKVLLLAAAMSLSAPAAQSAATVSALELALFGGSSKGELGEAQRRTAAADAAGERDAPPARPAASAQPRDEAEARQPAPEQQRGRRNDTRRGAPDAVLIERPVRL